jgi:hypothetical protein
MSSVITPKTWTIAALVLIASILLVILITDRLPRVQHRSFKSIDLVVVDADHLPVSNLTVSIVSPRFSDSPRGFGMESRETEHGMYRLEFRYIDGYSLPESLFIGPPGKCRIAIVRSDSRTNQLTITLSPWMTTGKVHCVWQ